MHEARPELCQALIERTGQAAMLDGGECHHTRGTVTSGFMPIMRTLSMMNEQALDTDEGPDDMYFRLWAATVELQSRDRCPVGIELRRDEYDKLRLSKLFARSMAYSHSGTVPLINGVPVWRRRSNPIEVNQ